VPDVLDGGAMPLVILIHGYGSSGKGHDGYFGLSRVTKARGLLLAVPDGTRDHTGKLFWNASEACCNFDDVKVDDVAYLDAIIRDVASKQPVDARRIFIIGHSNGAFMAHRYACERSDRVAAIVALAGVPWADDARCVGKGVSVLQVHGDADRVIDYAGGKSFGNGKPYPSAEDAVAMWASRNACGRERRTVAPAIDFDHAVPGAETGREVYDCPRGLGVELWRMRGSGHVPQLDARFANAAVDFLLAHPKPAGL
jgi:polyhydroxybutyrate depolymerase